MDRSQASDLVAGIMSRREVPFTSTEDGSSHRVLVGSSAIFVSFRDRHDDVAVCLHAPLLEQLSLTDEQRTDAATVVNRLNCEHSFVRFCLYDQVLAIEHDLLGSRMQGDEFMNALDLMAGMADELDDGLKQEIGGRTWAEVEADERGEAVDT